MSIQHPNQTTMSSPNTNDPTPTKKRKLTDLNELRPYISKTAFNKLTSIFTVDNIGKRNLLSLTDDELEAYVPKCKVRQEYYDSFHPRQTIRWSSIASFLDLDDATQHEWTQIFCLYDTCNCERRKLFSLNEAELSYYIPKWSKRQGLRELYEPGGHTEWSDVAKSLKLDDATLAEWKRIFYLPNERDSK